MAHFRIGIKGVSVLVGVGDIVENWGGCSWDFAGLILFDINVFLGCRTGVSMLCAVGLFDLHGGCKFSFLSNRSLIIVFIFCSLFCICFLTQSPIELIRFVKNVFRSFNCSLFAQFLWQGAGVVTSILSNIKVLFPWQGAGAGTLLWSNTKVLSSWGGSGAPPISLLELMPLCSSL